MIQEKNYGTHSDKQIREEPKDRYNMTQITMYLLGISFVLPWDFFSQANDFWMYKFRNVSAPELQTELQVSFSSYMSIASKLPFLLVLLANILINRFDSMSRMRLSFLAIIVLFAAISVLAPVDTDNNQDVFFTATMCIVVFINGMGGILQSTGTGIAGSLPKAFMGYNVNGMAISYIIASLAQIVSLLQSPHPTTSALIYFTFAVFVSCITWVIFEINMKTDFYKFYTSKQVKTSQRTFVENFMITVNIFKQIWMYALSTVCLFWAQISINPSLFVLIKPAPETVALLSERLFIPVCGFLVYGMCDFGGRLIALKIQIPDRYRHVTLALTILRVIFIPLLMFCNAQPRKHLPVFFHSDVTLIVFISLFALTNGYFISIVLSQAPKRVGEQYQQMAGTQMAFFLGLGVTLGSITSYEIIKLL